MDEIEQIKSKTDIVEFINQYVPLKRAGRNFKALCPFHQEKTPSFVISPERQIWHCFGGCGEGGDIFTFLMKWENIEFYEALKILAKRAGVKLKPGKWLTGHAKEKERVYEVNHLASEFYHFLLTSHRVGKKAFDYLSSRGIKKESIKLFSLGYAPAAWRTLFPFFRKKGFAEEELERAGLIIRQQARFYDRFRGRVVFTLKDHRGNVVGFSGRVLDPKVKEAKYINTPETLVYHKSDLLYGLDLTKKAVRESDEVIVTEGELDVISSYQAGVQNIVAIKGSALTESQVRLLKRFTENVTLALDSDLAGDQATRRGIETADRGGLFVKVIELKGGNDPDELIKKDPNLWKQAIEKRIPVYDFFLRSALVRLGGDKPEEKKRIAQELLPIWAKITDPIVQAHYVRKLARKLKISEESIIVALSKLEQKTESKKEAILPPAREKSREEILEEYFLALLLKLGQIKEFLEGCFEEKAEQCFSEGAIKKILKNLKSFLDQEKKFEIANFAKTLPKELLPALDRAYLESIEETFEKEKQKRAEIEKVFREIKKLFLRRKLKDLATKIKGKKAEGEFRSLTTQLKKLEKVR